MVFAGVSGSGVTSGLAAAGCVIGGGAAAGPLVLALGPAAVSIAAIAKEELRQRLAAARDRADDAEIRTRLYRFYSWCADAKIPELTRLATTIETWWPAILAFLHTGLSNVWDAPARSRRPSPCVDDAGGTKVDLEPGVWGVSHLWRWAFSPWMKNWNSCPAS